MVHRSVVAEGSRMVVAEDSHVVRGPVEAEDSHVVQLSQRNPKADGTENVIKNWKSFRNTCP